MKGLCVGVAAVLLAVAGCGDDTSNGAAATDAPTTTQTVPTETPGESDPGKDEPTDSDDGSTQPPGLSVRPLHQTEHTQIRAPDEAVLRTQAEWEETWSRVVAGHQPAPDPPQLDLDREMALFVALGERPSGGYRVEIDEVRRDGGALRAVAVEHVPGSNCATTRQITSPIVMVAVPRSDEPVTFVHRTEVDDCPDS